MRGKPIHPDPPVLLTIAGTCFILAVIALVIGLSSGCASSRVGKSLNLGVGIAKGFDQGTTDHAEARGAREANPILGSSQWRQVLVGALGVGVVIAGSQAIERSHPVLANVMRSVAILTFSAAAIHNARSTR